MPAVIAHAAREITSMSELPADSEKSCFAAYRLFFLRLLRQWHVTVAFLRRLSALQLISSPVSYKNICGCCSLILVACCDASFRTRRKFAGSVIRRNEENCWVTALRSGSLIRLFKDQSIQTYFNTMYGDYETSSNTQPDRV